MLFFRFNRYINFIMLFFMVLSLSACSKDSGNARTHFNKAFAYVNEKEYEKALVDFKEAALLAPDSLIYQFNLAVAYTYVEPDSKEAFVLFTNVVENMYTFEGVDKPNGYRSKSYYGIASIHALRGEVDLTILNLKKCALHANNLMAIYHTLSRDSDFTSMKEDEKFADFFEFYKTAKIKDVVEQFESDTGLKYTSD